MYVYSATFTVSAVKYNVHICIALNIKCQLFPYMYGCENVVKEMNKLNVASVKKEKRA